MQGTREVVGPALRTVGSPADVTRRPVGAADKCDYNAEC